MPPKADIDATQNGYRCHKKRIYVPKMPPKADIDAKAIFHLINSYK
jgi:hypothetical protein